MRTCGSCQLCCEVLSVDEIDKPKNARCDHQCPSGCAIYADRPGSCRDFSCYWLRAGEDESRSRLIPAKLRPDKCGAVIASTGSGDLVTLNIHVDPKRPKAWKKGALATWIEKQRKLFDIIIAVGTKRTFLGKTPDPIRLVRQERRSP